MPFPSFAGKHAHDPLVTAARFIEYMQERGAYGDEPAPENVVITFQASLVRKGQQSGIIAEDVMPGAQLFATAESAVGVAHASIGAPALAILVEELIVLGARRFVIVGTAGTLQRDVKIGQAVLCDGAIRDEGVSYHYLDDDSPAEPSAVLSSLLAETMKVGGPPFIEGRTWTIDAPYRETIEEARHYRDQGVLTVEMEASALFAVATCRKVEAAALFAVSDLLDELDWSPSFGAEVTAETQISLLQSAVTTLARLGRE